VDGRNLGRFYLPLAVSATVEALLMRCVNASYTRCRPAREMGWRTTDAEAAEPTTSPDEVRLKNASVEEIVAELKRRGAESVAINW